jgi:hypothetical protein
MRRPPLSSPVIDPRWIDGTRHESRTLWFTDGTSLLAQVTKIEGKGIQITSARINGFINASELCTVDRVHFRFGTRSEDAWVARVNATEEKRKLANA